MAKKRQRVGPCPKKFQILIGQHQKGDGRLIVLRDFGTNRFGKHIWFCGCDCGGHAVVSTSHFLSGHTKSCGCLQREIAAKIGKGNCSRRSRFSGQFARIAARRFSELASPTSESGGKISSQRACTSSPEKPTRLPHRAEKN